MKLSFIGIIYIILTIDINSLMINKAHGDSTIVLSMNNFCPESRFHCNNGECIPNKHICNGRRSCGDLSHYQKNKACFSMIHMNAYNATSCKNDFECSKGICLNRRYVCDSYKDCENGNDEKPELCSKHICQNHEFKCRYGGCIDEEYVCDDGKDCLDGSDEIPGECSKNLKIRSLIQNHAGFQFDYNDTTSISTTPKLTAQKISTLESTTEEITTAGNIISDTTTAKSPKKIAKCSHVSRANNGNNSLQSQYFYVLSSCIFIIHHLNNIFN
ncbi:hypothetical protein PV328_011618 [Microctonus aethiopoides]|uniref:Uncharacterized protein n=1 Tax=Microctonus aethiopoides TaxID=144406 RepID=A0AA39EWA0_9HYME|nr:hypothetical protein PV328_011618 [Microctonus aethiopoides]